jgi:hypothetical protein
MAKRGSKQVAPKRADQLRRAKRAQRARERRAGLVAMQLKLPRDLAEKLAAAARTRQFREDLERSLDEMVVRIGDYPNLSLIAWNRGDAFLPASEAFALYERNWRHVDQSRLDEHERALLERLTRRFGEGVINA